MPDKPIAPVPPILKELLPPAHAWVLAGMSNAFLRRSA